MKNLILLGSVLCFALFCAVLAAAKSTSPKEKWEKGWVSDSKCGVKGAGVGHEQCGKKCLAAGEHVVFVNEFSHKVVNVENPDTLKDLISRRGINGRDAQVRECQGAKAAPFSASSADPSVPSARPN